MSFNSSLLRQASLYKFRYVLGYGFVIVVLLFLISTDIGTVPYGLSDAEMNQAVASSSLHFSWDFSWLNNLLYNFLQKLSVEAFGLSRLSLLVPSLIFGSATAVVFALTMKQWFRDTVAVVATAIALTSVLFIGMVRSATPEIMASFWLSLLIFGAVRLLIKRDHAFVWKLLIVVSSLGIIYVPGGFYVLLVIITSAFFHPHVRSRFRHIKRYRLVLLGVVAAIGAAPFVAYAFINQSALSQLLAFDTINHSLTHFRANLSLLFDLYGNVLKNGFNGTTVVPVFNIATLALALLGVFQSVKLRFTARSYVLLSWLLATFVVALFIPAQTSLVFLPASFFMAIGIDALVVQWYGLFPRNPYARITGLIPLTVLFVGIAAGNFAHYFNNFAHLENPAYSQSLPAVQAALATEGERPVILVATPERLAFYSLLKKVHSELEVTTNLPADASTPTLILPETKQQLALTPSRIYTSANKNNSETLRVYRPQ